MKESKPLPKIALSAFNLLEASFNRPLNDLIQQTLEVKPDGDGWEVNFRSGNFERTVPDSPPQDG